LSDDHIKLRPAWHDAGVAGQLDLRDPTTRSLVWRAIATEEQRDPAKLQGKLDNMVKKSFDKYPPKIK